MIKRKAVTPSQQGFTLIELLVGTALSLIGILGGLVLFQQLLRVSVDSRVDARHDGQLASAMLQLQLGVQSAGYGIDDAGLEHFRVVDMKRVYWRLQTSAGPVCRGFDVHEQDDTVSLRMLRTNCALSDDLASLTWDEQARVAHFAQTPPEVSMVALASDCFPYGMGEAGSHYVLTVIAESSVRRNKRLGVEGTESLAIDLNNYTFCLPNIHQ